MVYDLSATPFFLRGSGYSEGTLFPWVVSDFSLIDAIESGIVKVPRVPVADDSMVGEQPTYRDLWLRIREHLPKKGRKTEDLAGDPNLPVELEGALQSLYSNYVKVLQAVGAEHKDGRERGLTPPVFIVVCNNTNVSKMVFDYVAGWEKTSARADEIMSWCRASCVCSVMWTDGRWLRPPEYDPDRQPAIGIGRRHERRFQENRQHVKSKNSKRIPARASRAGMPKT